MIIFMMLIISFSIMFILLKHPLSLGFNLMIQTILISMFSGMMSFNYWYSYIIFLVMIGGMLILFIYMTSIASNEKFKFSSKILLFFMLSFMLFWFILMFSDYFYFQINSFNNDLINQNLNLNFKFSLNKFFLYPLSNNFYLMIIYLLITLIMVVKMTSINQGPLRQKN
uniref:NADH-ubiquinone oxidoreductase chain 6 n=1 Tax=Lamiinae sp. GENSP02 TaxID=1205560 RepID=A0A0S2MSA7_9CUCU|nr:NADH deshydrogenase subunit 6 [Lamiinae sp. GENSP02]